MPIVSFAAGRSSLDLPKPGVLADGWLPGDFGINFVGMPRFSERPAQGALRPPTAVLACLLGYLSIEELDDEQQECKAN